MTIEELIKAAAAAMNMPESMVRKSAEARAAAAERPVEEILGEWAGVDPSAAAPASAEAPGAAEQPAAAEQPVAEQSAPAAAAASAGDSGDLLARAAEAQGMPEAMVKRSASARAKAEGKTTDEILAEWAGVDPSEVAAAEPAPAPAAAAPDEPAAPQPAAASGGDSGDLLARAAEAQGMPEAMVKRSASARAKAEGKTLEQILAEWAGVEAPAATAAATPAEAPPAASPAAAPEATEPAVAEVEVIGEEEPAAPAPDKPERELVTPAGALPRWLAALFVAVPLFALAYAGFLPNGPNCGDAGQLAVDPVTGVAVNCDGSEFGAEETDFFAIGADVYGVRCAACHGANGGGVASFPPFVDGELAATFPEGSCVDHQQWVILGSGGWPDATYGANDKPVGGSGVLMPAFGAQLSEQELAAVVLYERVQFAGFDLEATEADCGL